jgi:CheY-like chemotaxis protein
MQELKHCLVIDDDSDDQEIFEMCLGKIGVSVSYTPVSNGVDAIAMLQSNPEYTPDYIFIDMNMPKMNGMECLKRIRDIERLNSSRIFMYSTTAETKAVAESKLLGAEDFIIKPAKTQELKEVLTRIFNPASEAKKQTTNP